MPQSAEHFITAADYLARERQAELKSEYLNPAGNASVSGWPVRGNAGQDEREGDAVAGWIMNLDGAAQYARHQVIDDVQPQPAAAAA